MEPDALLSLGWPPLRTEAEHLARELYEAFPVGSPQNALYVTAKGGFGWDYTKATPWEEQTQEWRDRLVDGHAALLADLRRPASRDHWARWWIQHYGPLPTWERRRVSEIADAFRYDPESLRIALTQLGAT